jgi:GAF domain-containing protein
MLRRLAIVDSQPERVYDQLASSLSGLLDVPISMVNILDVDRDWFKSCVGLPLQESSAASSFCGAFFNTADPLIVVSDTISDPRFSANPFVQGPPFIRFYAGARLEVGGHTIGTLCAYDTQPKTLNGQQISDMIELAHAAMIALGGRVPQASKHRSE